MQYARKFLFSLGLAATLAIIPSSVQAFGSVGSVSIFANSGGSVGSFIQKARKYGAAGTKIRFTGRCDSACTLYLALPKYQTCVAPGAYFRFHLPVSRNSRMAQLAHLYMMRKYPGWVRSYIASNGGLSSRLMTMDYKYASRFMRRCA